jgi:hypothetical protein
LISVAQVVKNYLTKKEMKLKAELNAQIVGRFILMINQKNLNEFLGGYSKDEIEDFEERRKIPKQDFEGVIW